MIIGISAKAGCGKSTLTTILLQMLGPAWVKMSLADELKKEVAELFNFPIDWCYSAIGKECTVFVNPKIPGSVVMTVRQLLQYWGTDKWRAEDPERWTRKLVANMPDGKHVIIDDVRFVNEAEYIKKAGGKVIRLESFPGYQAPATGAQHISETDLDTYQGFDAIYRPAFGSLKETAYAVINGLSLPEEV